MQSLGMGYLETEAGVARQWVLKWLYSELPEGNDAVLSAVKKGIAQEMAAIGLNKWAALCKLVFF